MKIAVFFFLLGLGLVVPAPAQRAITHADYDAWKTASSATLSPDGQWVAYGYFPQDGDGEVILRAVDSGRETRLPAGARPLPTPPDPNAPLEEGPPAQRSVTIRFTDDSRYLVTTTFATKAALAEARKARKPEPNGGAILVELASGKQTAFDNVRSFQLPDEASNILVILKAGEAEARRPASEAPATPRKTYGSAAILHRFSDAKQRTLENVSEATLTRDGAHVVYAVAAKEDAGNGVYRLDLANFDAAPTAVLSGAGKYQKITWDEAQTKYAFLSDREDAAAKAPKPSLYLASRSDATAQPIVRPSTTGTTLSDKGGLSFSRNSAKLFFGVAEAPAPAPEPAAPAADAAQYELWKWNDDNIVPMQKVRRRQTENRTWRSVIDLASNKVTSLADASMADITPNETGEWAFGFDDRAWRRYVEFDTSYNDVYLVNTGNGERRLLGKQRSGRPQWSPDGAWGVWFDGKDWWSVSTKGTETNLTSRLGVAFFNELHDSPSRTSPYGGAQWSRDSRFVILSDRNDLWMVDPDGSTARRLTNGHGRRSGWRYSLQNLETDPRLRGVDLSQPLLLRGVHLDSFETGFFRSSTECCNNPEKLIAGPANYALASRGKAEKADRLVFTSSRFDQAPDLQVSDLRFANARKVSDMDAARAAFSWGTSELMRFRSTDGVALKAALYKPQNFDPKKKYPLLVYIYERLSQNVHNFINPGPGTSINIATYVSNGYVVITPDIAYRIGYPGQSALNCVIPAVDSVIDLGFIDEQRVGIQGHSWGGYQIAYMVTRTNRFKAAAPGALVANMVSAYNGIRWGSGLPRQFQYEKTQSRIGGSIWEYPMRFLENSPIFTADRVNTPLLMLHNDADDAVPWYQGIEFYLALRRLGREAWLFNYNGERHGLWRRPNQKDYTRRLQEFFDHHLKDAPRPEWMK
jgi:dienelactone hydrolase